MSAPPLTDESPPPLRVSHIRGVARELADVAAPRAPDDKATPQGRRASGFISSEWGMGVPVANVESRFRAGPARPGSTAWLNRSRRVLLALSGIWIIGVFDLGYTLSEWGTPGFIEMNPLATAILSGPRYIVFAFKFGSLGLGTCILLLLRRHRVAELSSWMLFLLKLWLALRWWAYFDGVLHYSVGTDPFDAGPVIE